MPFDLPQVLGPFPLPLLNINRIYTLFALFFYLILINNSSDQNLTTRSIALVIARIHPSFQLIEFPLQFMR